MHTIYMYVCKGEREISAYLLLNLSISPFPQILYALVLQREALRFLYRIPNQFIQLFFKSIPTLFLEHI